MQQILILKPSVFLSKAQTREKKRLCGSLKRSSPRWSRLMRRAPKSSKAFGGCCNAVLAIGEDWRCLQDGCRRNTTKVQKGVLRRRRNLLDLKRRGLTGANLLLLELHYGGGSQKLISQDFSKKYGSGSNVWCYRWTSRCASF